MESKFSADVPDSVKTADKVETKSLGTLEFFDGIPSPETVQKVYDNLDLKDGNWVQTIPGKSFDMVFRLYGPLEPWLEKTWKPGDFELVE